MTLTKNDLQLLEQEILQCKICVSGKMSSLLSISYFFKRFIPNPLALEKKCGAVVNVFYEAASQHCKK